MKLLAIFVAMAAIHLWTGAVSGEGASRLHRLARLSAIAGLVSLLASAVAISWASLTFPPGMYGHDMLWVFLALALLVASTLTSLGLCVVLHARSRRARA